MPVSCVGAGIFSLSVYNFSNGNLKKIRNGHIRCGGTDAAATNRNQNRENENDEENET